MKIGTLVFDEQDNAWLLYEKHSHFKTRVYFPFEENKSYDPYYDKQMAIIDYFSTEGKFYIIQVEDIKEK